MKPKTMILMVVAVACGLGASYMTSKLLADRGKVTEEVEKVDVVVAKEKIASWTAIKDPEKQFEVRKYLPESAPKNAISDVNKLKDQRLNKFIDADKPVTEDDLVSKDLRNINTDLKPGQRATTIRVTVESGLSGFVLPNSHVDVICTFRDDKATKLILQNVLVLAADTVDGTTKDPSAKTIQAQTVTLAAYPEEGARLALASSMGELRLLLRHPGDEVRLGTLTVKASDFDKPLPEFTGAKEKEQPEGQDDKSTAGSGTAAIEVPSNIPEPKIKDEPRAEVVKAPKAEEEGTKQAKKAKNKAPEKDPAAEDAEEEDDPLPRVRVQMTPRQPAKTHTMYLRSGSREEKVQVKTRREDETTETDDPEEGAGPAPVKKEEKPEPKAEQPKANPQQPRSGTSTKTNRNRAQR